MAKRPEPSLKARAIRYLSIREYGVRELERKLLPYVKEEDDLGELMVWLQEQGFLSESRFVDAYVRKQSARYGNMRILRDLQSRGISGEAGRQAIADMQESEFARARQVWLKKFGQKPADRKEMAKQIRFLQQRGFSGEIIRQVMRSDDVPEEW